jgi:cholest-4-en-3-one 26-monooxygenase
MSLLDPQSYAERGYPHAEWTRLRREPPVLVRPEQGIDYWAITRHEDIVWISRQPQLFRNTPRFKVSPGGEELSAARTLINMDPPEHGAYRRLASRHLAPQALRPLRGEIGRIAAETLAGWGRPGETGRCDFVERFAAPLPLAVLTVLLGLPPRDRSEVFHWTNALVGATDPEYQRRGEAPEQAIRRARRELFDYFSRLSHARRESPRGDLLSALTRAQIDGRPLPERELLDYYLILVVAGNETTRNAISGGLLALLEHPEQWARLRADPSLAAPAAEEILRWTSPVIHMARSAARDVELRGARIRAGDTLAMFYPSANRDEAVFDAPFEFRIDRHPNRHLAFGVGEHFCLGAHLARLELQRALLALMQRIEQVELAGRVERLAASSVGGIKRLPIRYRLSGAAAP